jgi:predicted peptidase
MAQKYFQTLILGFFVFVAATGQDLTLYQKRWLVQGADTLPYRVLLPHNYDSSKLYPILFFLHGGGERGNDNEKQLTHGGKLFVRDEVRRDYPAIVIFPQCSLSSYWSNVVRLHDPSGKRRFWFLEEGEQTKAMALLQQLVAYALEEYPVQKDAVFVGGLSMGAMGTYELVSRNPGVFRRAFAICGGAHPVTANKLRKTGWWVFHGLKDDVVDPQFSQAMAAALKKHRADVRLTLYPNANHNSWDSAFAEPELLPWLFSGRK